MRYWWSAGLEMFHCCLIWMVGLSPLLKLIVLHRKLIDVCDFRVWISRGDWGVSRMSATSDLQLAKIFQCVITLHVQILNLLRHLEWAWRGQRQHYTIHSITLKTTRASFQISERVLKSDHLWLGINFLDIKSTCHIGLHIMMRSKHAHLIYVRLLPTLIKIVVVRGRLIHS